MVRTRELLGSSALRPSGTVSPSSIGSRGCSAGPLTGFGTILPTGGSIWIGWDRSCGFCRREDWYQIRANDMLNHCGSKIFSRIPFLYDLM